MIQVELTRAAVAAACASMASFCEAQIKQKDEQIARLEQMLNERNFAIHEYSAAVRSIAEIVRMSTVENSASFLREVQHVVRERMNRLQDYVMQHAVSDYGGTSAAEEAPRSEDDQRAEDPGSVPDPEEWPEGTPHQPVGTV